MRAAKPAIHEGVSKIIFPLDNDNTYRKVKMIIFSL